MFACIFSRKPNASPRDYGDETALLNALTPYQQQDREGVYTDDHALICHALTFNTPESFHETTPYRCTTSGCVLASWVRLDNRAELATALNIALDSRVTDAALMVTAYLAWGDAFVQRLEGDFAFALYDPRQQRIVAARDSVGVKPFYYYCDADVFICATTAAAFHALKKPRLQPDESWMARYLVHRSNSWTDTALQGVKKLAPGHQLLVDANRQQLHRYFTFVDDAPACYVQNDEWVRLYRDKLDDAVHCRLRTQFAIGSETSGGIDSSTVTALAARMLEDRIEQLRCYGFAFLEREPEYVLLTSHFVGVMHNHIITRKRESTKIAGDIERLLTVLGLPEEHGNASFHIPFYENCTQHDIRVLFSGFGGDEVTTNPGYLLLPELIDARQYRALLHTLPGNAALRTARLAKQLLRDRKPRPDANPRFVAAFEQYWKHHIVNDHTVTRHNLRDVFMQSAEFDAPYRTVNSFILNNRIGEFVPTRLDNCTQMAASYRIDYRWPLLDRRLMQQYLSTPAIEKWHRGMGRYLHRRAIEGSVPPAVQWKASKEMGALPTDAGPRMPGAMMSDLQRQLHPLLEPLIDIARLKNLCEQPTAPGPAKRVLINAYMLNRWLQRYFA